MNVFLNETIAASYDAFYQTESGKKIDQLEKSAIANFFKNIKKEKILELGCGTGHWTNFFVTQGFKVTAIDISDAMLNVAKNKNLINACFYKADATKLFFPDESFEGVISITMLEFTKNPKTIIQEIYRVLKPGGFLILGCLNPDSVLGKNKNQNEIFKNAHFLNKKELLQLLQNFEDIEINECVKMNATFEVLDDIENDAAGIFLAVKAQKI